MMEDDLDMMEDDLEMMDDNLNMLKDNLEMWCHFGKIQLNPQNDGG
jgi:hypothetical protein